MQTLEHLFADGTSNLDCEGNGALTINADHERRRGDALQDERGRAAYEASQQHGKPWDELSDLARWSWIVRQPRKVTAR